MKVRNKNDIVTLKAIKRASDHEGCTFIESANIYLNNKKIGTYKESYMSGPPIIDIDMQEERLQEIAEAYCKTFQNGFLNDGIGTPMDELYKDSEIEGFISDIAMIQAYIEPDIKKILKTYPIAVIAKKTERHREEFWSVPNEKAMKEFDGQIVLLKAEVGRENFDVTV